MLSILPNAEPLYQHQAAQQLNSSLAVSSKPSSARVHAAAAGRLPSMGAGCPAMLLTSQATCWRDSTSTTACHKMICNTACPAHLLSSASTRSLHQVRQGFT